MAKSVAPRLGEVTSEWDVGEPTKAGEKEKASSIRSKKKTGATFLKAVEIRESVEDA